MLPLIRSVAPGSALDIGCNVGWYTVELATLGIPTLGVEGYPPYYRTALYAARRSRSERASILPMMIDDQNTRLLPQVDCTLFLSIWHHIVHKRGLAGATNVLREVWRKTDKVLFFESGEREMGRDFGLPEMLPDARTWLSSYLANISDGADVRHLGVHHGGNGGSEVAWRNLFALVRENSP